MKKYILLSVLCLFIFCGNANAGNHFDTRTFHFFMAGGGTNETAERAAFVVVNGAVDKYNALIDRLDDAEKRVFDSIGGNPAAIESAVKDAALIRLELLSGITNDDFARQNLESNMSMSSAVHIFRAYSLTPETSSVDAAFAAGFSGPDSEKYGYAYKNIYSSFRTNVITALTSSIRRQADKEFGRQTTAQSQGKTVEQMEQAREEQAKEVATRQESSVRGFFARLSFALPNAVMGFFVSFIMCIIICTKIMKETNHRGFVITSLFVSGVSSFLAFSLYISKMIAAFALFFYPLLFTFIFLLSLVLISLNTNVSKFVFSLPFLRRFKNIATFGTFGQAAPRSGTSSIGTGTHGSAAWGTVPEALHKGHIAPAAASFLLGRVPELMHEKENIFRYSGHLVVCAPTGSGKGIGSVIPNLLTYPGSAFVIDLKGENFAVTHEQRKALGSMPFKIDPFSVVKDSVNSRFNPLDDLDIENEDCISVSNSIASCLIMQEKAGELSHWDESAMNFIQGLILFVKTLEAEKQTLGEVRRLLTTGKNEFDTTCAFMCTAKDTAFGVIARAGNALVNKPEKERASIISSAARHTAFLDDPRISSALAGTDFDLMKIKEQPMSVFVILPPSKLAQNARFVRLILGSTLTALTSSEKQPPHKVAFFLDEFAQLGYVEQIESAISLLRGYGACFIVYLQDLSQLKGIYKKWQSFLANAAKVFYGTSDFDTAKYVSESLGVQTIEQTSNSTSQQLMKLGGGTSTSISETGRSLLTPDEVMRLGPENPIAIISGESPYLLKRLNYLTDAEFAGKFLSNPYHS